MNELTEREQKLLDFTKKLISVVTIHDIFNSKLYELATWERKALRDIGLTMEWQDDMLKFLESEYELKFTKLNPETHEEIK